jgi:hypothetical protein
VSSVPTTSKAKSAVAVAAIRAETENAVGPVLGNEASQAYFINAQWIKNLQRWLLLGHVLNLAEQAVGVGNTPAAVEKVGSGTSPNSMALIKSLQGSR